MAFDKFKIILISKFVFDSKKKLKYFLASFKNCDYL